MHSTKSENPTSQNSPNALKSWFLATRPQTWIASLSPVCIGAALAPQLHWPLLLCTLLFALLLQIGANFANDYFDFIKGADTPERKGPARAVQQGWITPKAMRNGTAIILSTAFLTALPLILRAGLWSLFPAILALLSALLYTGGPRPLGYLGLGELLVLLFFGPVATCGTYFLQTGAWPLTVLLASLPPGLLSCSLLIVNNLRDEATDRKAHKRTLVVRFGNTFGKWEYTLTLLLASLLPLLFAPVASLILLPAIPLIKKVFTYQDPKELIPVLQKSSGLLWLYTGLCSVIA